MNASTVLCSTCKHNSAARAIKKPGTPFSCRKLGFDCAGVERCYYYDGPSYPVDVAIITAVDIETQALMRHLLPNGAKAWRDGDRLLDFRYSHAEFRSDSQDMKISLVAAEANRNGLPSAAILATKLCRQFEPDYLVMVGITAGREKDTEIGDIIVPIEVYDYGAGKWNQARFRPNYRPMATNDDLVNMSRTIAEDKQSLQVIRDEWPSAAAPRSAPLIHTREKAVSGAAVVNSQAVWRLIDEHDKDVIAIDMEAYAVALAAFQCRHSQRRQGPAKVLIAKSVCDFGVRKSNELQDYAAYTSVRFLRLFFLELMRRARLQAGSGRPRARELRNAPVP